MEIVPQIDIREKARLNHEETIRLFAEIQRDFLQIGKLLTQCYEERYWRVLGYRSFREYAEYSLPINNSYSWATRLMNAYRLSATPLAPPNDSLIKIGIAKLSLLLPKARRAELNEALWNKAETLSYGELKRELGYKVAGKPTLMKDEQTYTHVEIQKKIKEIGRILGKYAKEEYRKGFYIYDVVWKSTQQVWGATHVFEVQHKGSVESALTKLLQAHQAMGRPLLFLVLMTTEDRNKVDSLLSSGTFREIADALTLLSPEQVDQLYKGLSPFEGIINRFIAR